MSGPDLSDLNIAGLINLGNLTFVFYIIFVCFNSVMWTIGFTMIRKKRQAALKEVKESIEFVKNEPNLAGITPYQKELMGVKPPRSYFLPGYFVFPWISGSVSFAAIIFFISIFIYYRLNVVVEALYDLPLTSFSLNIVPGLNMTMGTVALLTSSLLLIPLAVYLLFADKFAYERSCAFYCHTQRLGCHAWDEQYTSALKKMAEILAEKPDDTAIKFAYDLIEIQHVRLAQKQRIFRFLEQYTIIMTSNCGYKGGFSVWRNAFNYLKSAYPRYLYNPKYLFSFMTDEAVKDGELFPYLDHEEFGRGDNSFRSTLKADIETMYELIREMKFMARSDYYRIS